MSENVKTWLKILYENEIKEVNGTISNEKLWLKGAANGEEKMIHTQNISELEEYRDHLIELKENV